jgi:hypothetical protein
VTQSRAIGVPAKARAAGLLAFVVLVVPCGARADEKVPPPAGSGVICSEVCPPCPPFGPCPPCATTCASVDVQAVPPPVPSSGVVIVEDGAPPPPPPGLPPELDAAPPPPAPGTLELGYVGAFDGVNVMSGGMLRTTGHLEDVWFIDLMLGGAGADIGRGQALWEVITMLGVRVAGAVVPDVLRLFAALDTGITARGLSGLPSAPTWAAFATDVGGGLEVGFGSDFTAGFFVDVRLTTRVPFEREAAFVGVAWSAGIAALWF